MKPTRTRKSVYISKKQFIAISMTLVLFGTAVIIYVNDYSSSALIVASNQSPGNFNTSLSQAISIAEDSLGNNSFAVAGFGEKN
jgi:hypothetical protein